MPNWMNAHFGGGTGGSEDSDADVGTEAVDAMESGYTDQYALGQSLTANLTDSDGEFEAITEAATNDPYALGRPLF
jgi:hypothetical protein